MTESTLITVIFWLITAAISGAGAYFGAYLRKKGENLATHEDINKLVDQVSAVTKATKEVESKIEGEVWGRQRRWEAKRDILFDINKDTSQMVDALSSFYAMVMTDLTTMGPPRLDKRGQEYKRFNDAASHFEQSAFQADLVCGRELVGHLYKFGIMMREVVEEIHKEKPEVFDGAMTLITVKRDVIRGLSRRELGFEDDAATAHPKGW